MVSETPLAPQSVPFHHTESNYMRERLKYDFGNMSISFHNKSESLNMAEKNIKVKVSAYSIPLTIAKFNHIFNLRVVCVGLCSMF